MIRRLLFAVLLISVAVPLTAQTADPLTGLWSSESSFGPQLHGELRVMRKGARWTATISEGPTSFQVRGEEIRFAFGGRGAFRGRLEKNTITGFWLQPAGITTSTPNASGASQAFASPVVLRRTAAGVWRGEVHPLEERFTLYLRVFEGPDGSLLGAFRNPEQGSNGGTMQFKVTRDGDVVSFSGGDTKLAAKLVNDRLQMFWPDMNRVVELTRHTPAEASGFFPRPPGETYTYRKPPSLGDGWTTARASDVGMDEATLTKFI